MTPFDKFLQLLVKGWRLDAWILGKLGALVLFFLFVLFALVVVRQVSLMSRTVQTPLDKWLMWAGRGLFILAIAAFILGICIL
ncbi:MAG: DUF5657 family protein [Patescibacteria group bacterium]|nr:DUF5657 family protein [Patescibacteria group bacterium]